MTEAEEKDIDERLQKDLDEIRELHEEIKEEADRTDEEYDEKIKEMKVEEEEPDFADLESRYQDLQKEVSEARKKDKDVSMAHNLLLGFPSKLEIAKATRDAEDVEKAESILNEAKKELNEAKHKDKVDVRSEVDARFKAMMAMEGEEKAHKAFGNEEETDEKEEVIEDEEAIAIYRTPDDPEEYFHLQQGRDLKSIHEMIEFLKEAPEAEFKYYFKSRGVNDWARWIEGVFGYEELAEKIREVDDKDEMIRIVEKEAS